MSAHRTASVGRVAKDILKTPIRGDKIIRKLFLQLCTRSGTPLANVAYNHFMNGDFDSLTRLSIDPFFYDWNLRYADFELDYQIVSFFRKYQDFDLGINREELAYDKWLRAEGSCKRTNDLFRSRWVGASYFPHHVEEVFHLARQKVTEILGTVGPRELDCIRSGVRHGPGADTALRRSNSSGYAKYQTTGTITPACVTLYDDIFNSEDSDRRCDFAHHARTEHDSKLSFVPKTARIDRAICIEPRWNIYLQLGIGDLIAKRLRRYGQDIKCQERNQEAARRAYDHGLGTIDLSSASDSISINLVIDLLSCADPLWYDLLLKSRCHSTLYKGKRIRLEKISSMGNGYTFPLETLIFYALAWAATRYMRADTHTVQVYGDDIIVPRAVFSLLVETLECVGFAVNTDKSYASGSFFESCGKDYFRGREVRPFFVKKSVQTLEDAITLHNQLIAWAGNNQVLPGLLNLQRWLLARGCVLREIPRHLRLFGPTTLSGVFHSDFVEWSARRDRHGLEGVWVRAYVTKPVHEYRYGYFGLLYTKLSADTNSGHRVVSLGLRASAIKDILVPRIPEFVLDESRELGSAYWT